MIGPLSGSSAPAQHLDSGRSRPADVNADRPSLGEHQIEQLAREVLDSGSNAFGWNDYSARAEHFAHVLEDLTPAETTQLVQELLRLNPAATDSWMYLVNLPDVRDDGSVDHAWHGPREIVPLDQAGSDVQTGAPVALREQPLKG